MTQAKVDNKRSDEHLRLTNPNSTTAKLRAGKSAIYLGCLVQPATNKKMLAKAVYPLQLRAKKSSEAFANQKDESQLKSLETKAGQHLDFESTQAESKTLNTALMTVDKQPHVFDELKSFQNSFRKM